jgi:hypothetical protein
MVEVFYKTGSVSEEITTRSESYTLALAPVSPHLHVVMQIHAMWDFELMQLLRSAMVCTCQEHEGDAIREYDELRTILLSKGFGHVVVSGLLQLEQPFVPAVKINRRDVTPKAWRR